MNQNQSDSHLVKYDDQIVRNFVMATLLWSVVAMLLGVYIAFELANYKLNFGLPWFTFGRLRPLHTNAAIFAFAGNAVFAGIYYSTQRLLKTRMFSDGLSRFHFWGWQTIIVSAALTLPFGITVSKEYAELEWPISLLITIVWVVFAVNFFMTLKIRREKHMYVAVWFYIATVITTALLHVINTINIPVSLWKSYPVYAGVQDAMIQWWYGHNAVAFVLTTPFLGLMYYFLPKAVQRPVYSYRLSIIHFWSLVFIYIWAGPHHLLYTALPEWAQTVGMLFSVMLWAPSWGGMINGLLTMRGAWHRVRTEPVLKMFVAGLTFYGMATFEGPLLSVKSVSGLAHYTDWIIGHVHSGALGWNGFISFAMIYWMVPKLWKKELHSVAMANTHFWLGFLGILIYMTAMWAAGITQGLMWRAVDANTGKLLYPDFIVTVTKIVPLYWVRAVGGTLYLTGTIIGVINIVKTIASAPKSLPDEETRAAPLNPVKIPELFGEDSHRAAEGLPLVFSVLTALAVLVGSIIELAPALFADSYKTSEYGSAENLSTKIKPYTPLELHGRDLYVREGCYECHSQMIRPLQFDVLRYGDYSRVEESQYDHPFQWGSKRTGPDLARVGSKYPDLWHFRHMLDPREVVPGSVMPSYGWMFKDPTDFGILKKKLSVMKFMGVPYSDRDLEHADSDARLQAKQIAEGLQAQGVPAGYEDKEIIALISYLQRLGKDYGASKK